MSGTSVQAPDRQAIAAEWIRLNTSLPLRNRDALALLVADLAVRLEADSPGLIGVAGAPGSGKSTLARALAHCLAATGTPAGLLSLDDYYLGKEERARLGKEVHPLFKQRGAPGTHELALLMDHLNCIRAGQARGLRTPKFDKSRDEREPKHRWHQFDCSPRITLLEGWCIGAPPAHRSSLETAINQTEEKYDADGSWRAAMHRSWCRLHQSLNPVLDRLWYIRTPDWNCVAAWRWQQEQQLEKRSLTGPEAVREFLGTFERVVAHMQSSCEEWADLVFDADRQHMIALPRDT